MTPGGFLLDMGISPRVAAIIEDRGYRTLHTRDIGLRRADDTVIIDRADSEGLVVITTDTDLATVVALSGRRSPSVVTLRLDNPSGDEQAAAISAFLGSVAAESLQSAIFTVERGRYRRRPLPLKRE